ncbi:MAG: glycosyltransferase family 39 protein, partial [Pseudolysinimonas sp.]
MSVAIAGALALGAGLRTVQYVGSTSLWYDELTVALNIDKRPTVELIARPLAYRQVAPVGFLVAVKTATAFLGSSELAFRLIPWLSGVSAMFLFALVARRVVSGAGLTAAVMCFACSPALIWYGANVKPYSGDVAITLLLVWLALRFHERPDNAREAVAAGVLGGAATLCSFPAVPTALVLGLLLLAMHHRADRAVAAPLRSLTGLWLGASIAAAAAAFLLLDPATSLYMHRYWADGFMPIPSLTGDWAWIPRHLLTTFAHFLMFDPRELGIGGLAFVGFASAAAVGGAVVLFQNRSPEFALIVAPVV